MDTPRFALAQYRTAHHPAPRTGILVEGKVHAAPSVLGDRPLTDVLDEWAELEPVVWAMDLAELDLVPDAELLAPLTYPRKVLCAGANYYSHAEEMGTARPSPDAEPFFFLKPPTTTVVGPGVDVVLPPGDARVDWEVELGVVIGRGGRDIDEADALDHVAGYVIANDLSARGFFHRDDAVFPAFAWDWLAHKGLDGFLPLGPGVVPHWFVDDPQQLGIRLSVNGEVKQENSTADMVIGVARQIAAASRRVTLEPGDLIVTGTPAGVGMPRETFLAVGDVVVCEIHGLGRLENRMVAS